MSEIDDYRAALKAKVDGMQRDQQERELLLSDHSEKQGLPTPSPEFMQAHIPPQMSQAEIDMAAWQRLEKERSGEVHQWENTEPEPQSSEPVWQTEKIQSEFNREGEDRGALQLELALDQQQEKEAQRQRDQTIAEDKTRQIEDFKEKQRLANEQEQKRQRDELDRQAAARTQAEQEKQQAQANLAEQERAAPNNEVDQYRAVFEQAAQRTQSVERDIE